MKKKIRQLKITNLPLIVEAWGMIKKGTDKRFNMKHENPSQYEYKKMHFSELLIVFINVIGKISPKRGSRINT